MAIDNSQLYQWAMQDRLANPWKYTIDGGSTTQQYLNSKNAFGISKQNNLLSKVNIGSTMRGISAGLASIGSSIGKDAEIGDYTLRNGIYDMADPLFWAAGGNESKVGNAISDVGTEVFKYGVQFGNPFVMLGGGIAKGVGSLYNGAFGHRENKETNTLVGIINSNLNNASRLAFNANTTNDLLAASSMAGGLTEISKKGFKNGWFNSSGDKAYNKLVNSNNLAFAKYSNGLMRGAKNVDSNTDYIANMNTMAYGGILNNDGALGIMQQQNYLDTIDRRTSAIAQRGMFSPLSYAASDNKLAFGGELGTNGTDFTNGLLYIDNGGTHEENPLQGVPMGIDENGVPNLVEEGETVFNNYVFSNRMKVPTDTFGMLGLTGNLSDVTFAEASKKLSKESEQRPNDPISMAGLNDSLAKLAEIQEVERAKEEMKKIVESNEFAYGGDMGNIFSGEGDEPNKIYTPDTRSYATRIFGDNAFSRGLNTLGRLVSDPIGTIAGEQIDSAVDKVFEMSEPEMKKFFATDFGQKVASYIADMDDNQKSYIEAGRTGKTVGRITERLAHRGFKNAAKVAKRTIADVRKTQANAVRGTRKTGIKGTTNTNATRTSTNSVTGVKTTETLNPRVEGVTSRGAVKDGIEELEGTMKFGSSNKGALIGTGIGLGALGVGGIAYNDSQNNESTSKNVKHKTVYRVPGHDDLGIFNTEKEALDAWKQYKANKNIKKDVTPVKEDVKPAKGVSTSSPTSSSDASVSPTAEATPTKEENKFTPLDMSRVDLNGLNSMLQLKTPNENLNDEVKNNLTLTENIPGAYYGLDDIPTYDTRLRYAPAFGAGIMALTDALGLTNKPDYTYADKIEAAANRAGYAPNIRYTPIGDYVTYRPMDIWAEENRLAGISGATNRAINNTSSPIGTRNAALLANGYNTQIANGDLHRKALEYNDALRMQTADFNRKTNMFNSQMGLEADMSNARYRQMARQYQLSGLAQAAAMRDAIDQRVGASRSANLTNLFESLGNIGRENFVFNQLNWDRSRKYKTDKYGRSKYGNG